MILSPLWECPLILIVIMLKIVSTSNQQKSENLWEPDDPIFKKLGSSFSEHSLSMNLLGTSNVKSKSNNPGSGDSLG